ncbi:hypothetical protein HK102_007642 [Quaeritorhiza haematococci]|nr:hypothetical protein HK102_007642 [Quaeritorhiza haematococci]
MYCVLCHDPSSPMKPELSTPASRETDTTTGVHAANGETESSASTSMEEDKTGHVKDVDRDLEDLLLEEAMDENTEKMEEDEEEIQHQRQIRREQADRASKLLGQYLLQGWTMLNEACPRPSCYGVPLMRNKKNEKLCVICQSRYTEAEEPRQEPAKEPSSSISAELGTSSTPSATNLVPRNDTNKHTISPPSSVPADIKRRKVSPDEDMPQDAVSSSSTAVTIAATSSIAPVGALTQQLHPTSTFSSTAAAVHNQTDATITSLVGKMEQLRLMLEATPAQPISGQDLSETRAICDAIASCAAAIHACQTLTTRR